MPDPRKAYLVGGGIGSMAAAAFMVRDAGLPGANITIFENSPTLGGSLDGGGDPDAGYSLRGGRMFTTENFECTWDLFRTIPSATLAEKSVYEETVAFNDSHRSDARARLVDRRLAKVASASMGFSMQDRRELLRLTEADEDTIGRSRITDWLSPRFFETNFWFLWATTFAFQPWHSAIEFKRYLRRFVLEFTRIETLAGVKRTMFNQYDSLIRPLQAWLQAQGVRFETGCTVTELQHRTEDGVFHVTGLRLRRAGAAELQPIGESDFVFLQNASMTDASSLGTMTQPPEKLTKADSNGWRIWEALAQGRPQFGDPSAFNCDIARSCWESFTVTLKDPDFFERMRAFTGNDPGTGGLVTFRDSRWLLSILLPHQPHFARQPPGVQVFWGYALLPDRIGDFVARSMEDCGGADILREICGHLRFDPSIVASAICIPCRMPYITSMFMPRARADRPPPVPPGTRNFAFVSQFVEIPEDVVFTVEYSVRAAQIAVYRLLDVDRAVPPVTPHDKSAAAQLQALVKAFR